MQTVHAGHDGYWKEIGQAESADEAIKIAKGWLREGDWGEIEKSIVVGGHYRWGEEGGPIEIIVDPEEPACPKEAHHWTTPHEILGGCTSNPGCFARGARIKFTEICDLCGASQRIDSWDTNMSNGQNYQSVEYKPPGTWEEELREHELWRGEP